jgi:hypothetical protein
MYVHRRDSCAGIWSIKYVIRGRVKYNPAEGLHALEIGK